MISVDLREKGKHVERMKFCRWKFSGSILNGRSKENGSIDIKISSLESSIM